MFCTCRLKQIIQDFIHILRFCWLFSFFAWRLVQERLYQVRLALFRDSHVCAGGATRTVFHRRHVTPTWAPVAALSLALGRHGGGEEAPGTRKAYLTQGIRGSSDAPERCRCASFQGFFIPQHHNTHIHTYIHTYVHTYIHMNRYIYIAYIQIYIYIYIYTCTRIYRREKHMYMYTYIHIYVGLQQNVESHRDVR